MTMHQKGGTFSFAVALLALSLPACSDETSGEQPGPQLPFDGGGAVSTADAGVNDASPEASAAPADAGESRGDDAASVEGGATLPLALNGCETADYVEQPQGTAPVVIAVAAQGLDYSPRCMTIRAGQTVRWEGSLTAHPLAPGNPDDARAGTPGNPIAPTATGSSVEFSFPNAGTFPYYCELHAFGAGLGMAGSIHVR